MNYYVKYTGQKDIEKIDPKSPKSDNIKFT